VDRTLGTFRHTLEERNRQLEFASVLAGLSAATKHRSSGVYETTISVAQRQETQIDGTRLEWVEHSGIVWCPTTANSTWLARRNGTIYFTGNRTHNSSMMSPTSAAIDPQQNGDDLGSDKRTVSEASEP
jgi:hypothetical protein